jgi:uncharacterized protein
MTQPGTFIWHDLMTPDLKGSEGFYSKVVGWTVTDSGMPGAGTYHLLNVKGTSNGIAGMMPFPDDAPKSIPPFWSGYIYTPDVDEMAKRVVQLGGKIYREPQEVPGTVYFGIMLDPHGAMFNIMRPVNTSQEMTFPPTGTPGTIGWNELLSVNWEESWAFYSALFGWKKDQAVDMGPMGTYQTFNAGGPSFGGMMTKPPDNPAPPHWGYYIYVEGIDKAAKRVTENGGAVVFGPMDVPGGQWVLNAQDPQGGMFGLLSNSK